ncbi:MAG TPA: heavy metal translocating P-type ATPase [Spirochaetia bacterium]|nr:heavy metal translocating P-type ATPase [Spirochaetales bacterium]HRY78838.1 heavy metal translocating P-type ATPase [Spirochaetia bacterium]HRZ89756.1 heavy metal translocating P-type ATPase [Spirochaetia bacterium]
MESDSGRECSCATCSRAAEAESGARSRAGDPGRAVDPALTREGLFLGAAALVAGAGFLLESGLTGGPDAKPLVLALFVAAYLLAGWNVIAGAVRNLLAGRPFDELFLMTVSTIGAFLIGHPEEAVGVMVFYKIGELLQESAALRSRRSIRAVLALRPDSARVLRDGRPVVVRPEEVRVGEPVRVRPGERVPLDGVVEHGEGWVDSSALTGESVPRRALPGVEILAGSIAREGELTVRVIRPASESYAARIADLVENASHAKARPERFITRFARWYTPAVVAAAAGLAFLPPLLVPGQSLSDWVYRALVMLVISCPCALVLSVPLGYFAGLGGAARRGILVKGSQAFEALAEARTVVFDKTGTLTRGEFEVRAVIPRDGRSEREVLEGAVRAESGSNHPIAAALRREAGRRGLPPAPEAGAPVYRRETAGRGVSARDGESHVLAGSAAFLAEEGIALPEAPPEPELGAGTEVLVAADGSYLGRILLGDSVKPDAREALDRLRSQGIRRFVLLTGDARGPAHEAASELGIGEVHFGLLPHEKLERMETLLAKRNGEPGGILFVGDGINDAPVLARADVGVAVGTGADAALETADAVLMSDRLSALPEAVFRARKTRGIVRQNIVFALGFKLVFLALGAAGFADMWLAVVADVGVALTAVLNSVRALK